VICEAEATPGKDIVALWSPRIGGPLCQETKSETTEHHSTVDRTRSEPCARKSSCSFIDRPAAAGGAQCEGEEGRKRERAHPGGGRRSACFATPQGAVRPIP
jgi:hypothetical protein